MFLLDTMVLSEGFKTRPHPDVTSWVESVDDRLTRISILTIGEISRGIRKLERQDKARAVAFRDWLDTIVVDYEDRILPITVGTMRIWGPLTHDIRNANPDTLIAATAMEHNLTLVTRNIRHFEPTGVKLLNPYNPSRPLAAPGARL